MNSQYNPQMVCQELKKEEEEIIIDLINPYACIQVEIDMDIIMCKTFPRNI
jgi:hypothetical protein